ncbi:hypothetical protein [Streptantibioticus silvisoli]|uniref:hypothetical protein n=1 Tax=Streptantibioticus silvisoli TaxID=2705255 RepID=UPI0027E39497|nr:hypothetical protein [Streptantibioticus silvisoli]
MRRDHGTGDRLTPGADDMAGGRGAAGADRAGGVVGTAIVNARVFDGRRLTGPRTVVVDGGVISGRTDTAGARLVDAHGAVLLPGVIDAHVHLSGRETLEQRCGAGVTTALDMATWPPELVASPRELPGPPDIRSPGVPAVGPGGAHAAIPGMPRDALVAGPREANVTSPPGWPGAPTTRRSCWRTAVRTRPPPSAWSRRPARTA